MKNFGFLLPKQSVSIHEKVRIFHPKFRYFDFFFKDVVHFINSLVANWFLPTYTSQTQREKPMVYPGFEPSPPRLRVKHRHTKLPGCTETSDQQSVIRFGFDKNVRNWYPKIRMTGIREILRNFGRKKFTVHNWKSHRSDLERVPV
jgi:hypothetical protein